MSKLTSRARCLAREAGAPQNKRENQAALSCADAHVMSLLRKAGGKSKAQPIPDFPSAAAAATTSADLFTDAHAPKSSQDLAVHKKKVDEVRDWLKRADVSLQLGLPPTPRLLVLSGPPGAAARAPALPGCTNMRLQWAVCVEPRDLFFCTDCCERQVNSGP